MAESVLRVGSRSAQGLRSNNEDRLLVDLKQKLFLVADGMGGQECGELASGMAVDIIPRAVEKSLSASVTADKALVDALREANQAIVNAGKEQPIGRKMGTTAVCALNRDGQVFVGSLGDSRAYLIRTGQVEQLTVDHSVAQALVNSGALTAEDAQQSPFSNVLYRFLGCATTNDAADVKPFTPQTGDYLLLATDGLTNFVTKDDLRSGPRKFRDPQEWADHLVKTALDRGSRDNVSCIVVEFAEG